MADGDRGAQQVKEETMGKDIPTGAVGLKKGAKVSAVRPVQDYLKQFGYLESEGSPFVPDSMYMRRTSNDHILDAAPAASPGEFDDATIEALKHFQEFAGLEVTGGVD